jgi:poly [ADP-ribose] polymerase
MTAKNSFLTLYREKTGNEWGDADFKKCPGKLYPLEIDYGQEETDGGVQLDASAGSSSKLAPQIQDIIRIIFDVESMKKAMLEFEVMCGGWLVCGTLIHTPALGCEMLAYMKSSVRVGG